MSIDFISPLARDLEEFLAFKRAMGRTYDREVFRLRSFDRLAAEHAVRHAKLRLDRVIVDWLSRVEGRKPSTNRSEWSLVRQFCVFLRRRDPRSFLPDRDLAPAKTSRKFLPYIFSLDEVRLVLRETRTMHAPPFRALTFRTLMLVLFCTGLRFGEAVRLTIRDVDLRGRTFFIRQSKGRSRWVPFHDTLAQRLREYLKARAAITPASPGSRLFVQPTGMAYSAGSASGTIRCLLRRLGLKPRRGRVGPRPYDLRHAFAVHRLTRWYRAGVDLHAHLPWLSAYMGHDNLLGTETYLTATPGLLRLASRRFAARFRRVEMS